MLHQVVPNCLGSHASEIHYTLNPKASSAHAVSATTWAGCTSSQHKGHNLPTPLASLKILHGIILITKVLILPSCRVPFIQVPFSSQPDKLNLLQPDSPADFTACFVYSTSCLYLAEEGWDKWCESTAIRASMTTYNICCRSYKIYKVKTGPLDLSDTCKAHIERNKSMISSLSEL